MKKQKNEVEPRYIYVDYTRTSEGGEICAGQEEDEWPNYEPEQISVEIHGLHTDPDDRKGWPDQVEVDFDPQDYIGKELYLVVVYYQSGNTFRCSHGNAHFEGIYTDSQMAKKVERAINDNKYNGYKLWDGYFERLEGTEIHSFILDSPTSGIIRHT